MSNLRNVISHCGGVIGNYPFLVGKYLKAADPAYPESPLENEISIAKTLTEEAYLATTFLSGVNIARYGSLLNDLQKAFCVGRDEYLKTLISSDLVAKAESSFGGTHIPLVSPFWLISRS